MKDMDSKEVQEFIDMGRAQMAREVSIAMGQAPKTWMGLDTIINEVRSVFRGYTDAQARLLDFEAEGPTSLEDLKKELSEEELSKEYRDGSAEYRRGRHDGAGANSQLVLDALGVQAGVSTDEARKAKKRIEAQEARIEELSSLLDLEETS